MSKPQQKSKQKLRSSGSVLGQARINVQARKRRSTTFFFSRGGGAPPPPPPPRPRLDPPLPAELRVAQHVAGIMLQKKSLRTLGSVEKGLSFLSSVLCFGFGKK